MSSASQVDRVDVKDMTPARFDAEYRAKSRPVVIVGGAASWRARQLWNIDHLKKVVGDKAVVVRHNRTGVYDLNPTTEARPMGFHEAADTIASRTDGTYYLQYQSVPELAQELLTDIPRPGFLADDAYISSVNLWFGSTGCITPLHFDLLDNFLAQIMGTKRVTLFSPEENARLYAHETGPTHTSRVNVYAPDHAAFPLFADADQRRMTAMLEPSDVLFIPQLWWHAVETLSTSISVNQWWRTADERAEADRRYAEARCRWAELVTTDLAAAKAFYGSLCGWTFGDGSDVVTCAIPEGPVAALRRRKDGDTFSAFSQWVPYLHVEHLDEAIAKTTTHGGRVVQAPFDTGTAGRRAIVADPNGAAIGLWQPGRERARLLEAVGAVDVIDLLAVNASQQAFYRDTFGWTVHEIPTSPKGPYTLLAKSENPFGGIMQSPPQLEGRTHWVPYFQVSDCETSAAKALALGAKTVVPPTFIEGPGIHFAILLDPQGALFALLHAS